MYILCVKASQLYGQCNLGFYFRQFHQKFSLTKISPCRIIPGSEVKFIRWNFQTKIIQSVFQPSSAQIWKKHGCALQITNAEGGHREPARSRTLPLTILKNNSR
jgi:hypothetical protein